MMQWLKNATFAATASLDASRRNRLETNLICRGKGTETQRRKPMSFAQLTGNCPAGNADVTNWYNVTWRDHSHRSSILYSFVVKFVGIIDDEDGHLPIFISSPGITIYRRKIEYFTNIQLELQLIKISFQ